VPLTQIVLCTADNAILKSIHSFQIPARFYDASRQGPAVVLHKEWDLPEEKQSLLIPTSASTKRWSTGGERVHRLRVTDAGFLQSKLIE
jgi:hypothetical protein